MLRTLLRVSRATKGRLARASKIKEYMANHPVRKLHIGAGGNKLTGWLNTDLNLISSESIFLDASKPFPFPDETFEYIFSEHLIEHLAYEDGVQMLQECHRVLKKGGKCRVATPDLESLLGLYFKECQEIKQPIIEAYFNVCGSQPPYCSEVFLINNEFKSWGHQFLYNRSLLSRTMEETWFTEIKWFLPGQSDDTNFQAVERHGIVINAVEMNDYFTMVVEATRR
jgi:predicted SAM-dependent methyltransferase